MERRAITVHGIVQGVGFRPFIYTLAKTCRLAGFVRNDSGSVNIEIEGDATRVNLFMRELRHQLPPLAEIADLRWRHIALRNERRFRIIDSIEAAGAEIRISPDVAVCEDCLRELFDPLDRRFRYPFINCTNCGPRLTIVMGAPYDRPRTTMAGFPMCADCQREYHDPGDRRFHAQPLACPVCGPQLDLVRKGGQRSPAHDPLREFAKNIFAGRIGAIKGLGGYHLACDATNTRAVAELRRRKGRDEKPLAVMVRDVEAAGRLCAICQSERLLLESPQRPIVLMRKHACAAHSVCDAVAPRNPYLGVMLPYTPLHHLLLDAVAGVPLVMTSGNQSDEPIAYLDDDAVQRLSDIADVFLTNDRPIHVRCDDSVTRLVAGAELPIRRSRGYAPRPIRLPMACRRPILAVGGQLKGTFGLAAGSEATVSHHVGDLDHIAAYRQFQRDIDLYERLFRVSPEVLVHDLHPDYASTRYAPTAPHSSRLQRSPCNTTTRTWPVAWPKTN